MNGRTQLLAAMLSLLIALSMVAGCGGSESPYRADCEKEASQSGFSEDSDFWESAIEGCEKTLKSTHAKPGIFSEEP